jgi:hypothetical protein
LNAISRIYGDHGAEILGHAFSLLLLCLPPLIVSHRTPSTKSLWCHSCHPQATETKRSGMEEGTTAAQQPMEGHFGEECCEKSRPSIVLFPVLPSHLDLSPSFLTSLSVNKIRDLTPQDFSSLISKVFPFMNILTSEAEPKSELIAQLNPFVSFSCDESVSLLCSDMQPNLYLSYRNQGPPQFSHLAFPSQSSPPSSPFLSSDQVILRVVYKVLSHAVEVSCTIARTQFSSFSLMPQNADISTLEKDKIAMLWKNVLRVGSLLQTFLTIFS